MPMYNNPYQTYPQYYPPYPQQSPLMQQPQPQIQNGGFISVPSEAEARAWSVAAGTSVTFKDENAPYCYTKTMGFSQLDQPVFEKYRLVKEDATPAPHADAVAKENDAAMSNLQNDLKSLTERVARLEKQAGKRTRRVAEEDEDDV